MAKRRAEDALLHDSPSKRYCRSLCSVDIQAESMATNGSVSAPSLLALLGTRCRKRPCYFDDEEKPEDATPYFRTALCDTGKHTENILTVPISRSFQDRRSSCTFPNKKRPREDSTGSEKSIHNANDKTHGDKRSEDCTYNSFQYWRVPLPDLDLSLLEDTSDHSQIKEKPKVGDCSDAMET
ncbi:uncharacterized protein wu:fa19b12 isoform X1 [Melanotaenia boesemani]|uniref:uncharacterized protein wu:fa19b12 isoform X1 n=2 Tax=Melanotaenia boesemani TaxID=1250792 RepID=UPI001C03FF13|nr:uncharacterized protein wu:fa19b12 isoform X1 [Melanotaenia boesemani]